MTKNSERRLLFVTLFLTILLVSSAYAALIPKAQAAETTIQQKGLAVLDNVIGVDLAKYNVTTKQYPQNNQASYMGIVPQESVIYNLTSDENKLSLLYTFADGKLQMIQVLENEGVPSLGKSSFVANMLAARSFLSNYQNYTSDRFYGNLKSTLNDIGANKNFTKTSGNMQLEVTDIEDGSTIFKWYYTANGAVAPYSKFVALGFKNGYLTAFVNNWQLYGAGGTNVAVTKEEAIMTALNSAKAHSWSVTLDRETLANKNFNESNVRWAALLMDGSLGADEKRSDDPLILYPVWRVGIALYKWYGYMYGIEVDVWADTGQVRSVQEAWSTLPPPEGVQIADIAGQAPMMPGVQPNSMLTPLSIIAIASASLLIVWLSRKRSYARGILKPLSFKTGRIILCVLLSSAVFIGSVSIANATNAAEVWGSESTGAGAYPNSWRKHYTEIEYQRSVATAIASDFANNGYTAYNYQGNYGSWKSNILNNIEWLSDYYDYAAFIDFDHGIGGYPVPGYPNEWHYMFEDNRGSWYDGNYSTGYDAGVFDMEIYDITSSGKTAFAFINTCLSADLSYGQGMIDDARARGLPYAFTHGRSVADRSSTQGFTITQHMSDDGYLDPDWGTQVYIGFPYGSASLEQKVPLVIGNYYCCWVNSFFSSALGNDISVNSALDSASWQYMSEPFGSSPLRNGFTASWWGMDPQGDCTMAIYGNGNIHLKQYTSPPDTPNVPAVDGPTAGDTSTSYEYSAFAGDPYAHNVKYRFDWGDGSEYTETDWYSDGYTAYASHSWSSGGFYNVRVQSRCPNSDWSSWSSSYVVNIGNQPVWLTVSALDLWSWSQINPYVWVDDVPIGNAPVSIQVSGGLQHTVYVEDPVWLGYYYDYFSLYTGDFGDYLNPTTIFIDHDSEIIAGYV